MAWGQTRAVRVPAPVPPKPALEGGWPTPVHSGAVDQTRKAALDLGGRPRRRARGNAHDRQAAHLLQRLVHARLRISELCRQSVKEPRADNVSEPQC